MTTRAVKYSLTDVDWFKFYVGDYQRDTAHMSPTEHGLYLKLMLHYYATEKPLPDDFAYLCRVSGARTRYEKECLRSIRGTLFGISESKLIHARIEQEILKYQHQSDTNRRNVVDGRYTNRVRIPEARNQIPEKDQTSVAVAPVAGPVNGEQIQAIMDFLNAKTGKAFQVKAPNGALTAGAQLIKDRLKDGYELIDLKSVIISRNRDWHDDDKMRQYLTPQTLFRKSNFEKYLGMCRSSKGGG